MITTGKQKNSRGSGLVYAFLITLVLVLASATSGEARSSHEHHGYKAALPFDDHKADGHSCPLLHHPRNEVCPLIHHARIGNTVIKNCGDNAGTPSGFSFSKETAVSDITCSARLPLETRQLYFTTLSYKPLLPDPLDHPPKSL